MQLGKLVKGTLIRRYKRFLVDVRLDSGEIVTAHCPNTGSMKTCSDPGMGVYLSRKDSKTAKLKFGLELIDAGTGLVGVQTHKANDIVHEAIASGSVKSLAGFDEIRREVRYGENSRVDILLRKKDELCFVEVKNVTLKDGDLALFPDAVSERGLKHLVELAREKAAGNRAVILFLVNRMDVKSFAPATEIDPAYSAKLKEVKSLGVEVLALQTKITPESIEVDKSIRAYV
ncbi:MAG: DNA/RNA nuclease SfsA [Planctomycetes bacterium]|nr:DNA/RNA nuclease SfsA [Planctomycetota bacterium]